MITLLLYCFLNGFLFHFDPDIMTDNTKIQKYLHTLYV